MRLEAIELHRVALPLVRPFETSFGRETERDVLLVHVRTDAGDGWGECVAGRDPFYSSEYVEGAAAVIERYLAPALFAARQPATRPTTARAARNREIAPLASSVAPALAGIAGHRMAKAALEAAVLDAELRASGTSMGTFFGAERSWVDCGVSVGIAPSIDDLLDEVAGYVAEGYRRIKLKIKPGWDLLPVAAVRELLGPRGLLQVDANTAYSRADVPLLAELDAFGLLLVEQPFAEEDIASHVALAAASTTPVCLDESILDVTTALDAIDRGATSVVNIKAGRMGGYLEALAVHDACRERDVPVWCGGMLESGIGRAANVALAALPGFTLPGDTSGSRRYFAEDLTAPFELGEGEHRGQLAVPAGAGTGVTVRSDLVERLSSRSVTILER
ncbi:o-succinylbenzoate synthase [Agromyces atrinae]|uniref:o-succinylbenzoate synthase n=1 Tax=Agromyces atrinae TaxID=592376 RepID=A0A4Q2M0C5_9MICO|nr:o-succinylbenzoate synthase [Agromyces atrinae]NYD66982.1 O-succinylbenzoate synthase [Agromyces atrinae]RXZ85284.1 o-succinylbenzoate synthase [Agromyces atrinae]RXZ85392.1 o-succinylbenzoate synthase [Agromyces atrinae]